MGGPENLARGWWLARQQRDAEGNWDVTVQFADGHALELHLLATRDFDLVLAQAVDAHLRDDVRWTRRSERGGS